MITPITFIWESPLPGVQSTVYNLVYVSVLKADDPLCSAAKRPKMDENPPARLPGTKAYALKVSQLSENMRDFLKQVRLFFTKPHSLKRHGHFLAQNTYLKVEERVCCKYTASLRFMFCERAGHFWLNRPSTLPKP